jgi:hypothetical protein
MPLDVPSTIAVDTHIQVGRPKFRRPISENDCPAILRSFVHRTTSQGACGVSGSRSGVLKRGGWLANEELRECVCNTNGDDGRGLLNDEDDSLD